MLNRLVDTGAPVALQDTTLSLDVLGRFICNTWDEATNNGGVQFDAIVIGSGMFGAYCAEKIYRNSNLRVLVLEAGPFLVSESRPESGADRSERGWGRSGPRQRQ
jgi:hypothetical protein